MCEKVEGRDKLGNFKLSRLLYSKQIVLFKNVTVLMLLSTVLVKCQGVM